MAAARGWAFSGIACLLASAASAAWAEGEITIQPLMPPVQQRPSAPAPAAATVPPGRAPQPANGYSGYGRLGLALAGAPIHRVPDPRTSPIAALPKGRYVAVGGEQAGYYAILMSDGSVGWVPASHLRLLDYQVTQVRPGELPRTRPPASFQPPAPATSPELEKIVQTAYRYLGVPYRWGGNDFTGVDCSGLVKNCFAAAGISLPRRACEQARVGEPVPLNQLQPGDRLYFQSGSEIDHTGIYLGDGQFIHASGRSRRVVIESLDQPRYRRMLVEARR